MKEYIKRGYRKVYDDKGKLISKTPVNEPSTLILEDEEGDSDGSAISRDE